MKLSLLVCALLPLLAVASQEPLVQEAPVPGPNPLVNCGDSGDILHITYLSTDPLPPKAGESLTIEAIGWLSEPIVNGSYVQVEVKYGYIKLLTQKLDLCENAGEVDLECPVDEGAVHLTKTVDLPREIPPGVYTVLAKAFTEEGKPITCLTAKVKFNTGGGGLFSYGRE